MQTNAPIPSRISPRTADMRHHNQSPSTDADTSQLSALIAANRPPLGNSGQATQSTNAAASGATPHPARAVIACGCE